MAYASTHVQRPGQKEVRNTKFSVRQVISVITEPKLIDKLLKAWKNKVRSDYDLENEGEDNPKFMEEVTKWSPELSFSYDAEEACRKIWYHRMQ